MKRRLWPKLLFLSALMLAAGSYAVKTYPLMTLNNVQVFGSDEVADETFGLITGENLLNIDTDKIVETALTFPQVESVEARFNFRGDLMITLNEKKPVCYLYSGGLVGISSQCELIPIDSETAVSLPVVRGAKPIKGQPYSQIDDPSIHAAVKLVNLLNSTDPDAIGRVSEFLIDPEGLTLVLEPGTVVAELGWGDYDKKLYMLEVILAGNKNPALHLDLRFSDMVILRSRNSDREVTHGV